MKCYLVSYNSLKRLAHGEKWLARLHFLIPIFSRDAHLTKQSPPLHMCLHDTKLQTAFEEKKVLNILLYLPQIEHIRKLG
jgi:hypothetical protein